MIAKERVKRAPLRASALMNGAAGLPMISAYEWFSSTTTSVCAGRGSLAGLDDGDGAPVWPPAEADGDAALLAGLTEPVPADPHAASTTAAPIAKGAAILRRQRSAEPCTVTLSTAPWASMPTDAGPRVRPADPVVASVPSSRRFRCW